MVAYMDNILIHMMWKTKITHGNVMLMWRETLAFWILWVNLVLCIHYALFSAQVERDSTFCLKSLMTMFIFGFLQAYFQSLMIVLICKILPYYMMFLWKIETATSLALWPHWLLSYMCYCSSIVVGVILLAFNSRLEHLWAYMLPPSGPEEVHPMCVLYLCRKKGAMSLFRFLAPAWYQFCRLVIMNLSALGQVLCL